MCFFFARERAANARVEPLVQVYKKYGVCGLELLVCEALCYECMYACRRWRSSCGGMADAVLKALWLCRCRAASTLWCSAFALIEP